MEEVENQIWGVGENGGDGGLVAEDEDILDLPPYVL